MIGKTASINHARAVGCGKDRRRGNTPGQRLYMRLVGRPTARNGYFEELMIENGRVSKGTRESYETLVSENHAIMMYNPLLTQ